MAIVVTIVSCSIRILVGECVLKTTTSARRPTQLTSSQEVNVQVRHGLPSVRAVVHHDPKTLRQAFAVGDFTGHEEQVSKESGVLFACFTDTRDWLSWNYQKVDGSLRIYVAQHDALIVLMNEVPGDFAIYYFAEKSFLRHGGLDEQ